MAGEYSGGWVKLWRKLTQSQMYRSMTSAQRDVMIQCLILANHEEKEWEWGSQVFKCKPGQFITSLESLRESCAQDVSIQMIRTTIQKLEKWDFLANKSTKTGRLITVKNWELYQQEQQTQQQTQQQTANKQPTTTEEEEEGKEDNKKRERRFTPPSKQETADFFRQNGSTVEEAGKYWYHFDANGWKVGGRSPMKNWQSAAKKWILTSKTINTNGSAQRRNGTLAHQQPLTPECLPGIMQRIADDPRYT